MPPTLLLDSVNMNTIKRKQSLINRHNPVKDKKARTSPVINEGNIGQFADSFVDTEVLA